MSAAAIRIISIRVEMSYLRNGDSRTSLSHRFQRSLDFPLGARV